jgi:hypothetical protein
VNLFPMVAFDMIDNELADAALHDWGHWLGGCNRPFGRQSFGLYLQGELLCVAVSASTVNARCGGLNRNEIVELARLCSHPEHRDLTRVGLRLWRKIAADCWREYWPVHSYVSYSNAVRHKGDIYRFDGWTKVADVPGGHAGVNTGWTRPRKNYEAKSVWVFNIRSAATLNTLSGKGPNYVVPTEYDGDKEKQIEVTE